MFKTLSKYLWFTGNCRKRYAVLMFYDLGEKGATKEGR